MADLARNIWADGPAASPIQPPKVEIRKWGTRVEGWIDALATNSAAARATKALLDADLSSVADSLRWVLEDPTPANNGIYRKIGGPGTGSWKRVADLPYNVIYAQNSGGGTANAIIATATVPIGVAAYSQLISLPFTAANTDAMTLKINDDERPLVTNTGEPIPAGYVQPKMSALVQIDSDGNYRMFSYGDAAAIQAAAEAAQAAAEVAQAEAEAAAAAIATAPQWAFPSKAALALFSPPVAPDFVTFAGYAAAGDGGGAIYKKVSSEPSHAGKVQDGNDQWYELAEANPNPLMFGAAGDGSTDDTTALSNMLDFAPAKADIDLKRKTYKHTSLSITKDVSFRNGALTSAASTGVQISIDPDARFTARNVKFTGGGSKDTLTSHNIIYQLGASSADRAVGFDFEGCEFSGCGGVAVAAKFSDNIRLVNNKVSNFAYAGIQVLSCDNGLAEGNRVEGREAAGSSGDCYGMAFTHNSAGYNTDPNAGTPQAANPFCSGWRIIGNTVIAPKRWEGIDFHGGYNNIIAFNKVYGGAMGIQAGGSSGDATGYAGHDLLIMGNLVTSLNEDDTLSADTHPYAGITIQGGGAPPIYRNYKIVVTGNTVSGYGGVDPAGNVNANAAAIYGATGSMSFVISDNVVTDWAACALILMDGTGTGVISNNVFSGTRTSQEFDAVIKLLGTCSGRLAVTGNVLDDIVGNAPAFGILTSSAATAKVTYASDFRLASTAEINSGMSSPGEIRSAQYA